MGGVERTEKQVGGKYENSDRKYKNATFHCEINLRNYKERERERERGNEG